MLKRTIRTILFAIFQNNLIGGVEKDYSFRNVSDNLIYRLPRCGSLKTPLLRANFLYYTKQTTLLLRERLEKAWL